MPLGFGTVTEVVKEKFRKGYKIRCQNELYWLFQSETERTNSIERCCKVRNQICSAEEADQEPVKPTGGLNRG